MNTSVAEAIPTRKITGLASDDLFDLRYVRAAHLSPDGRHVAYVVSATEDDREFFQIHLAGLDGGYHRVLPFPGSATSPRWSPDGRWLAFVGDGRLHVACTSSWTTAAPLTEEELTVQGLPSWSPDSAQLAISVLQLPAPKSTRRITTRHFRAEGIGFTEDLTQRIAIVQRAIRNLDLGAKQPWGRLMRENSPSPAAIPVPALIATGTGDTIVAPAVVRDFARRACASGRTVRYLSVAGGGHATVARTEAPAILGWIDARFAGQRAPSSCGAI